MPEEGYTPIEAKLEASRCLMCADAPCTCGCPAGVDARDFIRKIRFDNLAGAVRALKRCNVLAASCARICPTGILCGKGCIVAGLSRPIDIGGLQRFVMDWERENGMIEPITPKQNGIKVAVVGSGPAGLGCATELLVRGYAVTVFEKSDVLGGMLRQCIPSWRLPDEVVEFEIDFIKKLGVEFVCNESKYKCLELLRDGFRAVFLATGLSRSRGGDMIGSELPGVYQALDLLQKSRRGELPNLGRRTVVIGGGDTALDAARTVKRFGAESFILYRRSQRDMPAYPNEVHDAWNEGVEFYFRTIVRSVIGSDKVKGVRCIRVHWHDEVPGMPRGYDVEGAEFGIACDSVILAMGQGPDSTFGLRTTPNGLLAIDKDTMMTSESGVFAGGDVAFGGGTASRAVGMGRRAAMRIDEYVTQGENRNHQR